MAGTVLDFEEFLNPDRLAADIAAKYQTWKSVRATKEEQWKELRNYLFAVDTSTTTNKRNGWGNSTTRPKLTQIRDNLHANYMAALFPNDAWLKWEADDSDSAVKQKRDVITSYMKTKLSQSDFETTVSRLVYDYIDYGNCFATVEYVNDVAIDPETQEEVVDYIGPKLVRLSPYDIVFNPLAPSFKDSTKIVKSLMSLGQLRKAIKENGKEEYEKIFQRLVDNRHFYRTGDFTSVDKSDGFVADGFGTINNYYSSDEVEVLTLYGDIYDSETDTLYDNHKITIVDRAYVIDDRPINDWLGHAPFFHAGWRLRPDNLMAMGPLDNLVGLQYRMDHLENMRADVFDKIGYPILKIYGDVEDFEDRPGEKIHLDGEGEVSYLAPDATALQADFQIAEIERTMEEMAGAPKAAMGIRTPGEKTAFEVGRLENAAGRIFQNKTEQFERVFLEPILNSMLAVARRNLDVIDTIRVLDEETGAILFPTISRDDIKAKGRIRPIGARHFAERATRIQNITNLHQIKISDPSVGTHFSGKKLAQLLAEELGEADLYGDNIGVIEQGETQQIVDEVAVELQSQQQAQVDAGI